MVKKETKGNAETGEQKRLLILGGMKISSEMVKKAQQMGMFVGVTDYNPPESSPAKLLADAHYMVSATDTDAVAELIRRERYDGVLVGFVDLLLPFYADICEKTGLPCYGSRELFELFTDKRRYKEQCVKYGVPVIREYRPGEPMDFPVIVKPSNSSGARGITVCYCEEELTPAVEKARSLSADGEILIEQYLDEKEVTVFWVFEDGEYYVAAVGNRHVKHGEASVIPLPVGYTYPSVYTADYLEHTAPKVREMLGGLGVRNGTMFMQCKVDKGVCRVYDIGYRLTPSLEYYHLEETCGYNPLEMMLHYAVTGKMAAESIRERVNPFHGQYAYNVSQLADVGEIREIAGMDGIGEYPGVLHTFASYGPGDAVTENMRGLLAQLSARVVGVSPDKERLAADILEIQKQVRVLSTDGRDLTLPGIQRTDLDGMLGEIK